MKLSDRVLSQLPGNVLERLRSADKLWQELRLGSSSVPCVIDESRESLGNTDWDVVISGGTLGILIGAALQKRGWRVALIERGILRGRDQEWNISRQELEVFLELDLLSESELDRAIATEYNSARVSFFQGSEVWVRDVLNIGIDPVYLLETLKLKFLEAGGTLLEKTPFDSATIHPDGVLIKAGEHVLKTRLLIDAMGHFSPIVKQARRGEKPAGVCLVVGSCAKGYPKNETGDLIVSFTPILNQCQYFWEAFPARDGRTTYLFTYVDTHRDRFSLEFFMEEYLRLLPEYQNVELNQLQFGRFLFGFFPSYPKSPLHLPWNRILAVGDSAGGQSPVSFGGFGSMVRHLKRLTFGIDEALKINLLDRNALSLLQPYQPNISVTWLFQKAMSVGIDKKVSPNQINDLMSGVFQVMDKLGDDVLKPFLQDVIQFSALSKTLPLVNPKLVLPILPQVGIFSLLDWSIHYINFALYSGLYPLGKLLRPAIKNLPSVSQYYYNRWLDAWQYGSGGDYHK
ncbi:FAD-dependent oxidoreductase [Hydrococcus rivularis NIES-593]|uniref:FAD-dependent oxidoreductase n=1 Tax=Hydrococcus rivularis NIES-593 TaxID=1921803 RepID=A0A1U7HKQ6_9CYAN|nr:FAD-dependent oxidoreductase [Hydrococcus rivularis]OKH24180.1 FAD-dependent oxidoreductase [Hydrococcus rivularis NIES-593]